MKTPIEILLTIVKTCLEDLTIQADHFESSMHHDLAGDLRARVEAYRVIVKEIEGGLRA